jgi:hypothetical protein
MKLPAKGNIVSIVLVVVQLVIPKESDCKPLKIIKWAVLVGLLGVSAYLAAM